MIGKTISHYKIIEKLGEGGMGVVYKAEDTKLDRTVALKFLTQQAIGSDEEKPRFVHEAKAAAALSHPNICTVHEIDESEGHTFIAMECVEGQTLKSRIESGPLKLKEAVDIAIQVAEGLQEAHEKGVVHRDIKPANVMVTSKDQAKIMDFGLAKAPGRTKLTKTGMTLGTAAYMSPEQARGGEIDSRTDIWSLGAVLYEMVTGQGPFKGDYEQAVMYSILNESPEPLTALRTGVPMDLERIVNKALAKRPDERYQHMGEILVDLRLVRKTLEAGASTPRPIGIGRPLGKRVFLYGGIVVVLALVIVGRPYFFPGRGEPIDSIAVLPLENMSGDPGEDYFVGGMHEALIKDLSKIEALRVISRTSVTRYKKTDKPISQIARELDVDVLVEGSVMRVGDRVRITAQLIRGSTDEYMWAESYDRDLRNVLAVISDVARSIAGEIRIALSAEDEEQLADSGPVDPEAYDALLMGQFNINALSPKNCLIALEYFQKARDIDPSFAQAYAMEGAAYVLLAHFGVRSVSEVVGPARAALGKALELDGQLATAHAAMGFIKLYFDRDWASAERELKRGLKGDPGNAMIRHCYADYLMVTGHLEESLEQVIIGRRYDPVSPMGVVPVLGHLVMARRYDEAVEECRKILAADADFPAARGLLAQGLWAKGMYEEALDEFRKDWAGDEELLAALERGYSDSGPTGAMLAVAELSATRTSEGGGRALEVAAHYAHAQEADSTLEWLEKAHEARETQILHIAALPYYDFLRGDPRFQDLCRRIGLSA